MRKIKIGDTIIYKENSKTLASGEIDDISIGSIYSRNEKYVKQCDIDEDPNGLVFIKGRLIFFNQIKQVIPREGK